MLPTKNASSFTETLVRYLILCGVCHQKGADVAKPDGEFLE
jgi:hypothetical protein